MRRVLGPGKLATQPCTGAEGKSVSRREKDKVMCTVCTSVFVFPPRHRLSPTLYLDWAGYLPISCQHRRYGTQCWNTGRGYCGMSLSIWWQALITPLPPSCLVSQRLFTTPLLDLFLLTIILMVASFHLPAHHGRGISPLLHLRPFFLRSVQQRVLKAIQTDNPSQAICTFCSALRVWIHPLRLFLKLQMLTPRQYRQWDN